MAHVMGPLVSGGIAVALLPVVDRENVFSSRLDSVGVLLLSARVKPMRGEVCCSE
jgi:hypothetical protein